MRLICERWMAWKKFAVRREERLKQFLVCVAEAAPLSAGCDPRLAATLFD